ncbi:AraC family transcriptional regulator [Chryseobacterium sp. MEBOG06]|uniref:helix-turn-helix transcriptional regulator n=1 Tax=unclassified Chryseobacterium TaxID=2593645 RepID=UPI001F3DE4AD|nr:MULTISPECIES: AraC family transcriptional regulator [unclassified Chryseobacterium]UKB85646.1 AraC family transcriptional regulator [Chryseobacterium sp. MEBOG06]
MELEIKATEGILFLSSIAKSIGSKVEGDLVRIPEHLGKGQIKGYIINSNMGMMIRQYEVHKNLKFKIIANKQKSETIMIAFHNVFREKQASRAELPYVQMASAGLDASFFIPAQTKMNSIIIGINAAYLKELLGLKEDHWLLQTIMSNNKPFLFEQIISPQIQEVAAEIVEKEIIEELQKFYLKVKTEELIFLLLLELLKRKDTSISSLNIADVQMIYKVKDKILSRLDIPPNLSELAAFACISESKLKRLFKQIFGNSIYSYYQTIRINEAAYLLREEKLSVSEVGYRLGFSNLSHFSRVFEEHIGIKPKKYWLMQS